MAKKTESRYIRYYTVGSAARELAPRVPEQPKTAPKPRKAKRITLYIDPVAILGIATAVFMAICLIIGLVELSNARAQQTAMAEYVLQLNITNAELTTKYYDNIDLEQIESSAKSMGMVPADQVEHITIEVPEN